MNRPNRIALIQKVTRLAKLTPGKTTSGYMSRNQLLQLIVFLEHRIDTIKRVDEVEDNGEDADK